MKKVIAFLLTAAIALGFLGYAHASVTASQDDLLVYPAYETGDSAPLQDLTADMTFLCGQYLRWDTSHTFGGETVSEFAFNPDGWYSESPYRAGLEVYLSRGFGASTAGGGFSISNSEYGALLRAASAGVGDNEHKTTNLRMSDYVNYYMPDYDLTYDDGALRCNEQMSLSGLLSGDNWYETPEEYEAFFARFRFPVQPEHIVAITVGKDDLRRIVEIQMEPLNGPELYFVSDVNAHGVWFVPIFQDENGNPLPYDSPAGHGVYHAPWKVTGSSGYEDARIDLVTPDMDALELLIPLDESLRILDMEIDSDSGTVWMLTNEEGSCILSRISLATGETRKTKTLTLDPNAESIYASFVRDDGYLLVTGQEQIALVSEADVGLLLTAADLVGEGNRAAYYTPHEGSIRFDGENLYLMANCGHWDGAFWTAIWRQGETVYYGEYDCTLLRGNDDYYYSSIIGNAYPITLR